MHPVDHDTGDRPAGGRQPVSRAARRRKTRQNETKETLFESDLAESVPPQTPCTELVADRPQSGGSLSLDPHLWLGCLPPGSIADDLSAKQVQALVALSAGAGVAETARMIGVGRATIYRWLNEDAGFAAELNRIRQERLDAIRSGLHLLSATAVETLQQLLGQPGVPAEVRLKTALAVLDRLGVSQPEPIGPTDPAAVRRRYYAEMHL